VVRFTVLFCVWSAAFHAVVFIPIWKPFLSHYLSWNANLASSVLRLLGQQPQVTGASLSSSHFAIIVSPECAAGEFMVFFCAALLAFPASFHRKMVGIGVGLVSLVLLNVGRIVTLFLVGTWRPKDFVMIHEELWPSLLVLGTILIAVGWICWTTSDPKWNHAPAGKTN
jgi:exosortase/archaeosortase family protein